MNPISEETWVFTSAGKNKFPGAVFSSLAKAEEWIRKYSLSGTLTQYPLDIAVYDWAIMNRYFTPKGSDQQAPSFVGGFTSAVQTHYHYQDGQRSR
jgi:hypothetical protein